MVLVAFRHGLRASELVDLRWDQIDFNGAVLHVRRVKQGTPATHPIMGDELRALRQLQREQDPKSPFVFTSERGAPFSTSGFAKLVARAGEAAGLGFPAHPHMLRHSCGFKLANDGVDTRSLQAYLGHRHIQHTKIKSRILLGRMFPQPCAAGVAFLEHSDKVLKVTDGGRGTQVKPATASTDRNTRTNSIYRGI